MNLTADQASALLDIKQRMRAKAIQVGPLHGWWDYICDIDALIQAQKPLVPIASVDEFIAKLREQLAV